uniref:Transthyretin-like family protein n=1 Tax=Rhabditophanes sp. KR3021 TaxID=114890 RepID=A0AC35TZV4_9BILA
MKFVLVTATVFLLATSCMSIGIGRKQTVGVKGKLLCSGKPASGILVKLYDDDSGIDTDDLMAKTKTDNSGTFSMSSHAYEIMTIDAKINIYHDCEDGFMPCQRKLTVYVPDKYVFSGDHADEFYDAGVIELSGKFKGETRDCIHRMT